MYKDYMSYIKRIRDNLIQCGVSLPYNLVGNLEDPKELFKVSESINDILYYYKIMSIGGSADALQGFFLPLDGYYKNKMREIAYQEFMDVIDSYAKLLGADSSSVDIGLNPSMWDDDYDEEEDEDDESYEEEYQSTLEEEKLAGAYENPLIGRFRVMEESGGALFDREREEKSRGLEKGDNVEAVQGDASPSSIGTQREKAENTSLFEGNGARYSPDDVSGCNEERQDGRWAGKRIVGGDGAEEREHIQEKDTERGNGNTGYDTQKESEEDGIGVDATDFASLFSFNSDDSFTDEDGNNTINPLHSENTDVKNVFTGVPPLIGDSIDYVTYEEHGIYLDDVDLDSSNTVETTNFDNTDTYEEHGVYLDDISVDDSDTYTEHGTYLDEINDTSSSDADMYAEHGVYLDEIEIDSTSEGFEEVDEPDGWVEDDEDEEEVDEVQYDENGFEVVDEPQWGEDDEDEDYEGDEIQYDEDGFEVVEEESWIEDDEEDTSDDTQYDEDGFEVVEEESWLEDDDEEDDDNADTVQYDEDGFEVVEEESWIDDDDEEYNEGDDGVQYDEDGFEIVEESWVEDDEEDESEEDYDSGGFEEVDDLGWGSSDDEDEEDEQPPQQVRETTTQQVVTPPMRNESEDIDITDKLTEGTNKLLTSIKRGFAQFLSNQSQK